MTTQTRVPPHNLQAEQSVLGAILLSRDALEDTIEHLNPDDFYKPAHGHVYDAVMALYGSGEPVDAVTVAEALQTAGLLEELGGPAALLDLQQTTPAIGNAAHYARIVADKAQLRRLARAGTDITELAYSNPDDVAAAVDNSETVVFALADQRTTNTTRDSKAALHEAIDLIEHRAETAGQITGNPTGFADLDNMTAGLQPNALYVIGARPAMGKSAMAMQLASATAATGRPVLFFSLEMSVAELTIRRLCTEALVDSSRVRVGAIGDPEWTRISHAVGRLGEQPFFIDDNPATTVMDIRAKARRIKQRHGDLGLVIIDYVQLMTGRAKSESRQVEVSEISRGLKVLAREIQAPVVALAQLNRSLEQRHDKRPILSDLRESGALEQDADVVAFLYRDEVYDDNSHDKGVAEVIVAKHRNGPTGKVRLAWRGQYTRFDNMARLGRPGPQAPDANGSSPVGDDDWSNRRTDIA